MNTGEGELCRRILRRKVREHFEISTVGFDELCLLLPSLSHCCVEVSLLFSAVLRTRWTGFYLT
uniref:Uncharacterized protein n=1 Tax=Arundo donax TaxID=35708 RepID=A0A0A9A2I5_ARUDO